VIRVSPESIRTNGGGLPATVRAERGEPVTLARPPSHNEQVVDGEFLDSNRLLSQRTQSSEMYSMAAGRKMPP